MRKTNEISLGDALKKMMETYRLMPKYREAKARTVWANLREGRYAAETREVHLIEQKLYIWLEGASLKHHLMYEKPLLLTEINEAIGEQWVKDLIIC